MTFVAYKFTGVCCVGAYLLVERMSMEHLCILCAYVCFVCAGVCARAGAYLSIDFLCFVFFVRFLGKDAMGCERGFGA